MRPTSRGPRRRRALLAASLAVSLGLVGACGSGDDDRGTGAPDHPAPFPGDGDGDGDGAAAGASAACWSAPPAGGTGVSFTDVTRASGLVDPLRGMYGHAAAAADVDGDGWTDLFVAGFADRPARDYRVRGADGPAPDRLLRGGAGGFEVDPSFPGEPARTSGATFADLDADGDLDLVVVRNPRPDGEVASRPTTVYRNDGDGWAAATALVPDTAARSVAALDVDRDGLADLAIAGDRFGESPTRLLRNTGGLRFEDASDEWGLPDDLFGLALSPVDLDADGWLDLVVSGDPRVLRGGPDGFTVVDVPALRWRAVGDEDDPAGIAVGDLDGDGAPDLAIGQHFNSTIDAGERVPVRLFLNRSGDGGIDLVDVTDEAGSPSLPTKAPHVAVADLDADGLADVVTSAATADGTPVVLRGTGVVDGVPRFEVVGEPAAGAYWVTGVTDDFDHDGRVDVFMVEWEPSRPSLLLRGAGGGGPWVGVDLAALGTEAGGARVDARLGGRVVATAWAASTTGYAAGAPPTVRLGLGDAAEAATAVELVVTPPGGRARTLIAPVRASVALDGC